MLGKQVQGVGPGTAPIQWVLSSPLSKAMELGRCERVPLKHFFVIGFDRCRSPVDNQ